MTLWVNNCRAMKPRRWLLHPQKLPRHSFAAMAIKGQMRSQPVDAKCDLPAASRPNTAPSMRADYQFTLMFAKAITFAHLPAALAISAPN